MICPDCVRYRNTCFCEECGKPTLAHNCRGCNSSLSAMQKFCGKCGLAAPPLPVREEVTQ